MVWIINNVIFRNAKKETPPNITSVGRPARRQSPVSEPLRSVFRPLSNGNGPSWIWLVLIRLNYGCDKRVRYCALIFAADIVPSLSTIQWDLKKPACESTEGSARPLKKKISWSNTKVNFCFLSKICWQLLFIVMWNDVGGASITRRGRFRIGGIEMWGI